jgi:hypothetical protein
MRNCDLNLGLSIVELQSEHVLALPERMALSLVNANAAIPINAALALNVLADGSTASSTATPHAPSGPGWMKAAPGAGTGA